MALSEIRLDYKRTDPFRTCDGCRVAESLRDVFLPLTQAAAILGSGGGIVTQVEEASLGVNMLGLPKSQLVIVNSEHPVLRDIGAVIGAAARMAYQNCKQARASETCPQTVSPGYLPYPDINTFAVVSTYSGVTPMFEEIGNNDRLLRSGDE